MRYEVSWMSTLIIWKSPWPERFPVCGNCILQLSLLWLPSPRSWRCPLHSPSEWEEHVTLIGLPSCLSPYLAAVLCQMVFVNGIQGRKPCTFFISSSLDRSKSGQYLCYSLLLTMKIPCLGVEGSRDCQPLMRDLKLGHDEYYWQASGNYELLPK